MADICATRSTVLLATQNRINARSLRSSIQSSLRSGVLVTFDLRPRRDDLLTPQKTQKNQSGQHFWPNLLLGRWLKGIAFEKFKK
jgi:hypothetical protein